MSTVLRIRLEPPKNLGDIITKLLQIPGGMERAARNAVSRTLKGGRQDAIRRAGARYTAPQAIVRNSIRTRVSGLNGVMKSTGARNPLDKFKHRPTKRPKRMPAGGVYAQVVKGQGGYLQHAFLMKNNSVYERVGASRFPIKKLFAPSAPGMIAIPPVSKFVVQKMEERLAINLNHAAAAVISGWL